MQNDVFVSHDSSAALRAAYTAHVSTPIYLTTDDRDFAPSVYCSAQLTEILAFGVTTS